ncbi:unknown [Coraliomargarita sp. CAG:312]|nr:unknown [Coraliomargarita sp. CAG:312]
MCGGSSTWLRRFAMLVPAAIQPASLPITSTIETRSWLPMASWSRANSRIVVQRYFTTLPYPGQWSVIVRSLSIVLGIPMTRIS